MRKRNFSDDMYVKITDAEEKKALRKIARYDRKLQQKTFENMRKHDDLIVHFRENTYGNRKVVQAQFKTLGCRMKKAGSCWNCNYGVSDYCIITPNQYVKAFKRELKNLEGNVLVLESLGSITDSKEFNPEIFKEILKLAIDTGKFDTILIETHITQIQEELVQYINTINAGKKQIGFEVGIEDMSPENRKLINKIGVQNDKLEEVYHMLQKYGILLEINLIYGLPFMNEKERIQAVYNSVKYISQNLPEADIVLFLMSIKENTIMEYMHQKGIYKPANPWGLVELTKQIILDKYIQNIITYSWFGEKEDPYIQEQTCYTCPDCKNKIIEFFRNINGTFDPIERRNLLGKLLQEARSDKCGCYEKLMLELQQSDGENPRNKI